MSVVLRDLDAGSEAAWDRFVEAMPAGTFFHRAGWARVVQTAFGHATHYCFTERDGAITGVLPLARVQHPAVRRHARFPTRSASMAAQLAADAQSRAALAAHAEALRRRTRRQRGAGVPPPRRPAGQCRRLDAQRPDLYVTFRKQIGADSEHNLKAIPRKQRAMVRKGDPNRTDIAMSGRAVDGLHRVYAESVRNLGTPVFSRRYFRILMDVFGNAADVVTVMHKDAPVAAVMNFYFRDEVLPYYGGGTTAARACAGNDFMYWEVMRRAAERGAPAV